MRETWYVLEDGSVADPRECAADDKGVLRNKAGVAVAMRGDTHSSRGIDPEEERAKAKAKSKEMRAEDPAMRAEDPKRPYRTREMKAD
jgi:hypothetical protein